MLFGTVAIRISTLKASKDDIVVGKVIINRRDQVKYWGTNFHGDIRRHYKINGENAILSCHQGG